MGKHVKQVENLNQKKHAKRVANKLFLLFLLVVAGVLLAWPLIVNMRTQTSYQTQFDELDSWSETLSSESATTASATTPDLDRALSYLQDYNQKVREGLIPVINDPWGFSSQDTDFSASGLTDSLVGEIIIPKMEVDLPIYLGSTEENMLKGATVVYGTSAPLGEANSNTTIAAHRGFSDGYMFNYIERLEVGDTFTIKTAWAELGYTVRGFKVVDPSDVESIKVQEGKSLVTLLTCHPHPQHNKRLLVIAELTYKKEINGEVENLNTSSEIDGISSNIPELEDEFKLFGLDVLELQFIAIRIGLLIDIFLIILVLLGFICKRKRSN